MLEMRSMQDNFLLLHGNTTRGLERVQSSPQFEGQFGRMFRPREPADFDEKNLKALALRMGADVDHPTPEEEDDPEETPAISAGYPSRGQFIDPDLTFDPASSLQR